MSKITLDEAIKHCFEVAEQLDEKAKTLTFPHLPTEMKKCRECAADHRQLAEWLTELKELKIENEELKRYLIQANNRIPPIRLIT